MSYPTMPPPAMTPAVAPASPAGRPPVVSVAAVLLWVMAAVGLIYAIATIAVVPGTVSRFRAAVDGTGSFGQSFNGGTDPDTYVAVVWLGAAVGLAIGVILFALYVVLGIALRRGSNTARITTLVFCGLGALAGAGALIAVAAERGGDRSPWSVGEQLSQAYPSGWLGVNVTLAAAQILAYGLVAILILAAPKVFFRRAASPDAPSSALPRYGSAFPPAPGYGPPPGYPAFSGYPQPAPAPGYGPAPVFGQPGVPDPSVYGPASAPPALGGYGPASAPPAASVPSAQGFAGPASAPPVQGFAGPASAPPVPGAGPYPPAPGAAPYPPAAGYGQPPAAGPWTTPPAYGYYGPPPHGPGYPVAPSGQEPLSDWARPPVAGPEQPSAPAPTEGSASPAVAGPVETEGPAASEAGPVVDGPVASKAGPSADGGRVASEDGPADGGPAGSASGPAAVDGGVVESQAGPAVEGGVVASQAGPAAAEGESATVSGPASQTPGDSGPAKPSDDSPFVRPAGLAEDRSFAPTGDTGTGEPPNQTPDPAQPTAAVDQDFWARPTE
jgi:hypothetical protein